jgi:hypothetical protein
VIKLYLTLAALAGLEQRRENRSFVFSKQLGYFFLALENVSPLLIRCAEHPSNPDMWVNIRKGKETTNSKILETDPCPGYLGRLAEWVVLSHTGCDFIVQGNTRYAASFVLTVSLSKGQHIQQINDWSLHNEVRRMTLAAYLCYYQHLLLALCPRVCCCNMSNKLLSQGSNVNGP